MEAEAAARQKSAYDVYLEERKLLIDAEREGARTFDKAILTLSAGALALSITFLEKIVRVDQTTIWWGLIASWIAFGGSILLILFSFLTSQWACRRQIEILDEELINDAGQRKSKTNNNWTTATTVLNIASILSFTVGVTFFCCFSFANLPKETAMSEKQKDYGFVPPKAPAKTVEKGIIPPKSPSRPIEEGYTPPKTPAAPPPPAPAPEKK